MIIVIQYDDGFYNRGGWPVTLEEATRYPTREAADADLVSLMYGATIVEIDESKLITNSDKAAILDWLLTPVDSGRPDRPARLARTISKNSLQALMSFQAWGTPEEILEAMKKEMKNDLAR